MTDADLDDAALYARHARRLIALATTLAGPSAAEDVVSAAMVRVLASPGWTGVQDRGAYLTRAVVNEVRNAHRADLRREARELRASRNRSIEPVDAVPEVLAALAGLPLRQRAVVFLAYWADMTPAAIAAELGIREGTVRQHLARARRSLRRTLQ
jgi:RNA polymerase sigma-70 factor, ECF subfamily